jgi:hypothetical protein
MSDRDLRDTQQGCGAQQAGVAPRSAGNLVFIGLCLVALLAGAGVPMFFTGGADECYLEELFGAANPSGAVDG